jgi:hypothetical protein
LAAIFVPFFAILEAQTMQGAAGNAEIIAVAAALLAAAALVGVLTFRFRREPH